VGQEDADSDYFFGNFLQRAAFRSIQRERQPKLGSDPKTSAFREASGAVADVSVSLREFIRQTRCRLGLARM
jgi:hypothetical protein